MPVPLTLGDSVRPAIPANYEEANAIIEQYLKESPNRSAPALLLKGVYLSKTGELDEAFSYFDQASIEYPKQSEYLLDMFNAYQQRAYLVKSVESRYVLELYKSSMEGFGFFSPNFHKAMIHQKNGDMAQTQEEIRRHLFQKRWSGGK
jgi:tetratricopeptide (TPR) repeat protein